jgi:hypothetical protein
MRCNLQLQAPLILAGHPLSAYSIIASHRHIFLLCDNIFYFISSKSRERSYRYLFYHHLQTSIHVHFYQLQLLYQHGCLGTIMAPTHKIAVIQLHPKVQATVSVV